MASTCLLRIYNFQPGDLVLIHADHKNRLAARTREYWEERIFLPHLPYVLLTREKTFTFLGNDTIQEFALCKWLVDSGIWYTCIHRNHEKFVKVEKLNEI